MLYFGLLSKVSVCGITIKENMYTSYVILLRTNARNSWIPEALKEQQKNMRETI